MQGQSKSKKSKSKKSKSKSKMSAPRCSPKGEMLLIHAN